MSPPESCQVTLLKSPVPEVESAIWLRTVGRLSVVPASATAKSNTLTASPTVSFVVSRVTGSATLADAFTVESLSTVAVMVKLLAVELAPSPSFTTVLKTRAPADGAVYLRNLRNSETFAGVAPEVLKSMRKSAPASPV